MTDIGSQRNCQWSEGMSGPVNEKKPLKIVVVGDGLVGKTCLLVTYTRNEFPIEYEPTVFDNLSCNIFVDEKEYCLTIWDTAGQEDYEKLRNLSYPNTDCFLICYAIDSNISIANVVIKWVPEIRKYCSGAPIVLVGTKSDLRVPGSSKFVSTSQARKVQRKIRASALVECSAMKRAGLIEVFEEAIRATEKTQPVASACCACNLL